MKIDGWIIAALIGILVVLVGLYLLLQPDARLDSFQRQCGAAGGHIYKPASTSWCLTPDGRFIEVYP